MGGMLLRRKSESWQAPAISGFSNEALLEDILASHPSLIPGVSGEAQVRRQFPTGAGPADLVVVDEDGAVTVVECKLAANPQVRREVVGQLLDYAAQLWQMPLDDFLSRWQKGQHGPLSEGPLPGAGALLDGVAESLASGGFNLVLAVDQINDGLRAMVEYLNEVTLASTGVMALQLAYFTDRSTEYLLPSVYGAELLGAKQKKADSVAGKPWTVEAFRQWCAEHYPESMPKVETFLDAVEASEFGIHGGRGSHPSLIVTYQDPASGPRGVLTVYTKPGLDVEVRLTNFQGNALLVKRLDDAICSIPEIPIPVDAIRASGYSKRPNVSLTLFSETQIRLLIERLAAAFDQISSGEGMT